MNSSSFLERICEEFLILVILFAAVYILKAICEQKRLEIHLSAYLKLRLFTFLNSVLRYFLRSLQLMGKGKMKVALPSQNSLHKIVGFCFVDLELLYAWLNHVLAYEQVWYLLSAVIGKVAASTLHKDHQNSMWIYAGVLVNRDISLSQATCEWIW